MDGIGFTLYDLKKRQNGTKYAGTFQKYSQILSHHIQIQPATGSTIGNVDCTTEKLSRVN